MNSEKSLAENKARKLAEKVVGRLNSNEISSDDFVSLRQTIEKFDRRLTNIETKLNPQFAIHNPQSLHPSQEKFNVEEAIITEMVDYFEEEKACLFEPNKACDKCSMCSSRGF